MGRFFLCVSVIAELVAQGVPVYGNVFSRPDAEFEELPGVVLGCLLVDVHRRTNGSFRGFHEDLQRVWLRRRFLDYSRLGP